MSLPEDLEDELCHFIIRKPRPEDEKDKSKWADTYNGEKVHDVIPLMLKDVLGTSKKTIGVYSVFTKPYKTLYFRSCIVHAYVAGVGVHNKSYNTFYIADDTGTMVASIYNKNKDKNVIETLYNEVKALKSTALSMCNDNLADAMMRLMKAALESVSSSSIKQGDNVILYGHPSEFQDKTYLEAYSFSLDNSRSRELEIAFNDTLIKWYKENRVREV